MTVATFKITKNVVKKVIDLTVGDQMTLEEADRFAREFQRTAKSIDASSWTLDVDCTGMKVLTQDLTLKLTGAMGLYKEAGFQKVIFTVKENNILKMQLMRVARTAGLNNFEVVSI
ncbi:MAG TPA: hypothetical protein VNS08_11235 [Ureibacillus sp.]|nr:hypothetical protein [Ureibacillus sp.]